MEFASRGRKKRLFNAVNRLNASIVLFYFVGFLMVTLKPTDNFSIQNLIIVPAVTFVLYINLNALPKIFPVDRLLLAIVNFLCALGVLVLYSTNPSMGIQQAIYYCLGTIFMLFCIIFVKYAFSWEFITLPLLIVSVILLTLPIVVGKEVNGAKNWIYISKISIQPSEIVKLSVVIISAYSMSRFRRIYWIVFLIISMVLLMLQRDLGAVLIYFTVMIFMYYASNGSKRIIAGMGLLGMGVAVFSYNRFAHIKRRVAIWINPWVDYQNSGYQLVQSLIAIASGGVFGMGLGLGNPTVVPIYHTDFIFAVICEQFGLIFAALVLCLYGLIVIRAGFIAQTAQTRFHALLAIGCSSMIAVQTFVIISGVIKLIPLTGVTLPFVSYGGSSLISSMGIIGLLQGVAGFNRDRLKDDAYMASVDKR